MANPLPRISSLDPDSGPVGASVTITGRYLGATTRVTFNDAPAAFHITDARTLTATVPETTSGPVRVFASRGSATSPYPFIVETPAPPVTGQRTSGALEP